MVSFLGGFSVEMVEDKMGSAGDPRRRIRIVLPRVRSSMSYNGPSWRFVFLLSQESILSVSSRFRILSWKSIEMKVDQLKR